MKLADKVISTILGEFHRGARVRSNGTSFASNRRTGTVMAVNDPVVMSKPWAQRAGTLVHVHLDADPCGNGSDEVDGTPVWNFFPSQLSPIDESDGEEANE